MVPGSALDTTLARIQTIDRGDFEEFVADVFETAGWSTSVTQPSHDEGVDVEASRQGVIHQRAAVQAKRPNSGNKVTAPEVRETAAVEREIEVDCVVVATSAPFTKDAYQWAGENNVKLMDGVALAAYVVARDLGDLLDNYAEPLGEQEPEELFPVEEWARDKYYERHPIQLAANVFHEKGILEAMDAIRDMEIGGRVVESITSLSEAIESDSNTAPSEVLIENPQFVSGKWPRPRYNEEVTDVLIKKVEADRTPGAEVEIQYYEDPLNATVVLLLEPSNAIDRTHLEIAETCLDLAGYDTDLPDNEVRSLVVGSQLQDDSMTTQKRKRLRGYRVEIRTYDQMLKKVIGAHSELFSVIKPYYRAQQNHEALEDIQALEELIEPDGNEDT